VAEQRVALNLALAHVIERSIEQGMLDDCTAAATLLGLTRALVTQVMSLLNLSPRIQDGILTEEITTSGRQLPPLLRHAVWDEQAKEMS